MSETSTISVLIPCFNEESTIGTVIEDFRRELPDADIVVVNNRSTDSTAHVAARSGARVIHEPRPGKGFAVEAIFSVAEADICIMVDGDDTYPADQVHNLIDPIRRGEADMVVGARLAEISRRSFPPFHVFGNRLIRNLNNWIFGTELTDILSGYRAFNRRVLGRIPVVSSGFEVETELTAQMLYYRLKTVEIEVPYRERPAGSVSKLRTFRDGVRVLWTLFNLLRSFKPLTLFGGIGLLFLFSGVIVGIAPFSDLIRTGEVDLWGKALAASVLAILSAISFVLGLLLHAVNWRLLELHNVLTRRGAGVAQLAQNPTSREETDH